MVCGARILGSVLRWPLRLASVLALTAVAAGWGDWFSGRSFGGAIFLLVMSLLLAVALAWIYKPGGMAAFEYDDSQPRRAPGEPAPAPAPPKKPRRRRPEPAPEPAPRPAAAPAAAPAPAPRPPAAASPLWSGERRRAPRPVGAPATGELDLNTAGPAELAPLPGVGRVWAERIVQDREARGPFGSVDDLARLENFNTAKLPALRERLRV